MRFALRDVFFNQDCQKYILNLFASDLEKMNDVPPLDWLGLPLRPPQPPRKRPIQWSMPDIISADRRAQDDPDAQKVNFDAACKEIRRIAQEGTGLHCTFMVIVAILLSDHLINFIAAGTPKAIADSYFEGFELRVTRGFCGEMGYDSTEESKSGRVIYNSKPPCQLALDELNLVERAYTAHFCKSQYHKNKF